MGIMATVAIGVSTRLLFAVSEGLLHFRWIQEPVDDASLLKVQPPIGEPHQHQTELGVQIHSLPFQQGLENRGVR